MTDHVVAQPLQLPARQRCRQLWLDCPPPWDLTLAELRHWHQHGAARWREPGGAEPLSSELTELYSWLDVKLELARRLLKACNYCVHDCRINRIAGETGYCRLDARARISGSYLHWGEEAPLSPTWAVFFSGCTMHCLYCHNWRETFDLDAGRELNPAQLAAQLQAEAGRYRTLSLIGGTPEPHLHTILELASHLSDAVDVPLVFNGNATLSAEGLALMEGLIDIYLPDFKHGNDSCAWQLTKIGGYLESFSNNLKAYLNQGAAVLVRHLVVPGHLDCCTRPVLEMLARDYPGVAVNVMFQYRPIYKAMERETLNRTLSRDEKDCVTAWVKELGIRCLS